MYRAAKIIVPTAAVVLLASASWLIKADGTTVETASPTATSPTFSQAGASYVILGINNLVNDSDVGLIGEITAVSAPRWNSIDGKIWQPSVGESGPYGTPTEYRDATVKVTEMLFSQPGIAAAVGAELKVRLYGTGVAGRGQAISEVNPALTTDFRDGPFNVGAKQLLLLRRNSFYIRGGPEQQVLQLTNGFQANWVLEGEIATSAEDTRNAHVGALTARIKEERKRGTVIPGPDDPTIRNPLAFEGAVSTTSSSQGPNVFLPAPG